MAEEQKTTELTEEEIKREKRRIYQREYMKKRRETDPEFAEKQRAIVRNIATNKYHSDNDYKNKKAEYNQQYYQKFKDAYKEVRLALKN